VHVVETSFVESSTPALPSHLRVRDEALPLVALHRLLGVETPADSRRLPAIVLEFGGRRLALTCDRIIGAREIVVKSLGPLLAPIGLYAGATISGAGKVQLILDPATLVHAAYPVEGVPEAVPPSRSGPILRLEQLTPQPTVPARILVADDSRSVRESLSRMLAAEGHIVDLAVDGEEAWRMLGEVRYDMLVTDLEMPGLDGWQLIEKVRGAAGVDWQAIPIVVISSQKGAPSRLRAEKAGASVFLAKPVTRRVLAEKVVELLARRS
jgi:CheY-like chemotaxis protein